MKRSISPDPDFSPKTHKLVHHSPDDGEEDLSPPLPATSSGDGIFVKKKKKPFHIDPFTHIVERRDSKLYLEDAWKLLQPAIHIIFKSPSEEGVFKMIDCNAIYFSVKTACSVEPGQVNVLYDLIKQECEPYIASAIQSLVKPSSGDAYVFLPLVETCWLGFKWKMMFVFNLAMVLPCGRSTLWDMGLALFQKQLSLAPQVQDQVIAGILGLVNDERSRKTGENLSLIKNLRDMFRGQRVVIEKLFLGSTSKFYSAEAEVIPPLPATSSGDGIFVEKKKKPFHIDPFTHIVERRDSKLYLEDAWKLLQPAIHIIFKSPSEEGVFKIIDCNAIYFSVKTACSVEPRQVKVLYDLIKQECEPYIASAIQSLVKPSSGDAYVFLPLVETCWLGFKWKMMFVFNLAMVLPCGRSTLWDMGLALFQKQLSLAPQVQDQVIAGILGLVNDERSRKTGENLSLIKNLMDMFRGQRVVIEKLFLDSTSKFYSAEAEEALQLSSISWYLKYAEETLLGEEEKCNECYYFYSACRISVMKTVARELLEVRAGGLVKGFWVLMDEVCVDDLRRMYRVFNHADQMDSLDRIMRSYIQEKGAREEESLQEWSSSIKERWRQCFRNDALLEKSIKESFESLGFHVPGEFSDEEWESDVD